MTEGDACAPVCVDLQRGTLGRVEDTFITPTSPSFGYGAYPYLTSSPASSGGKLALITYDLSPIPAGAQVLSSTMTLLQSYKASADTIEVYRALIPWREADAVFSSFGGFDAIPEATFTTLAGRFGPVSVDLTALTRRWLDSSMPNAGVVLRQETGASTSFRSSEHPTMAERPKLTVCYIAP